MWYKYVGILKNSLGIENILKERVIKMKRIFIFSALVLIFLCCSKNPLEPEEKIEDGFKVRSFQLRRNISSLKGNADSTLTPITSPPPVTNF